MAQENGATPTRFRFSVVISRIELVSTSCFTLPPWCMVRDDPKEETTEETLNLDPRPKGAALGTPLATTARGTYPRSVDHDPSEEPDFGPDDEEERDEDLNDPPLAPQKIAGGDPPDEEEEEEVVVEDTEESEGDQATATVTEQAASAPVPTKRRGARAGNNDNNVGSTATGDPNVKR